MFWQGPASLSGQILIGNWKLPTWPCSQFSISQSRGLLPPAWPHIIVISVSPDSDVNYLSIWTQVRRRGPRPRASLVWSALVIITHITILQSRPRRRCFPDITRETGLSSAKFGTSFAYYYRGDLKTEHVEAPLAIWGAMGGRPSDLSRHRPSLLSLG